MKKGFTKQDFYALLKPNGDCLEWTRATNPYGYGFTRVNGKIVKAHRLALELEGIDTTGWNVLHSCDNPPCCNPEHLRTGTQKENVQDMMDRNRKILNPARGERSGSAVWTEGQVLKMRSMYSSGMTQVKIAEHFNTKPANIHAILVRKNWKHI